MNSLRLETHRAALPGSSSLSGHAHLRRRRRERGRRLMLVEERKKCYEARDAYFSCLDANGGRRQRRALRKLYEKHCPSSWVKHFDKKRAEDESFVANFEQVYNILLCIF